MIPTSPTPTQFLLVVALAVAAAVGARALTDRLEPPRDPRTALPWVPSQPEVPR